MPRPRSETSNRSSGNRRVLGSSPTTCPSSSAPRSAQFRLRRHDTRAGCPADDRVPPGRLTSGVPGETSHDLARGFGYQEPLHDVEVSNAAHVCEPGGAPGSAPFLSLPTSCTGTIEDTVEADASKAPGVFTEPLTASVPALDGCVALEFGSEIKLSPDVSSPAPHRPDGGRTCPPGRGAERE